MSRRIKLVDKNGGYSLRLLELVCDVKIKGFLSECTTILKFRNEQNSEIVESELSFPLNEGATICGYAADINGVVVDAVVVEKQKAREVFDNETKKFEKKKAALAEQVVGNVFSTSINCTAPLAVRTIKLVFIQPLKFDAKTSTYTYKLPFQLSEPIPHFGLTSAVTQIAGITSARLVINSSAVRQNVSNLLDTAGHFPFQTMGGHFALNFNLNDVTFDGEDLMIRTAVNPQTKHMALLEQVNKEVFFAVHDWSKINRISNNTASRQSGTPKIAVYWQRSFNLRDEASTGRQIELLGKILQEMSKQSVTTCDVLTFGETVDTALGHYGMDYNSLTTVATDLRKLQYEGALDLESLSMHLKELVEHNPNSYRAIIVFTDGINALGPTRIAAPSLGVPLHIICGPEKCNPTLMGNWSKNNGGKFINLNETSNNDEVVKSIASGNNQTAFGLVSADVNVTGDTSIYPRQLLDLTEDGVSIYGSVSTETISKNVPLKVTLKYGKAGVAVEESVINLALKLPQQDDDIAMKDVDNDDTANHFIGKYWANVKIKHMGEEKNKDELKEEFVALGRRFGIVSEYTSYLILENLEEYVKYEIEPPRSLHNVWQQYQDIMMARKLRADKQQDNKLAIVESLWSRKVKWWQNEHIKSKTDGLVLHFLPLEVEAKDSFNNPYWQDAKTRPLDLSAEQELTDLAFDKKLSLKRKDPEPWSEFEISQTETYEAVRKKQMTELTRKVPAGIPRSYLRSPEAFITPSYESRLARSRSRSRSPPRRTSQVVRDNRDRDRDRDRRRSRSRSRSPVYRRRSRSRSRSPRRYRSRSRSRDRSRDGRVRGSLSERRSSRSRSRSPARSRSRSRSPARRRRSRSPPSRSLSRSRSVSPSSPANSASSSSSSSDDEMAASGLKKYGHLKRGGFRGRGGFEDSSGFGGSRGRGGFGDRGGRGSNRGRGGFGDRGGRGGSRGRGGSHFDSTDWSMHRDDKKDKKDEKKHVFFDDDEEEKQLTSIPTRTTNVHGDEMIVTTTSPYEQVVFNTFSNSNNNNSNNDRPVVGGKGLGKGGARRHRKVLRDDDDASDDDDTESIAPSSSKSEWNIPPAVSNWKNSAGFTIPLDKRLPASSTSTSSTVSNGFAKFSEALHVAENKAREEIASRSGSGVAPLAPPVGLIAARRAGKVNRKMKRKSSEERMDASNLTAASSKPRDSYVTISLDRELDSYMDQSTETTTAVQRQQMMQQLQQNQQQQQIFTPVPDSLAMPVSTPAPPKTKLSNMMRVLGPGAVQDPVQLEETVRKEMAERQRQYMQDRAATPQQNFMYSMPSSTPAGEAMPLEAGMPLTPKEAFKRLSHKFHGKQSQSAKTTSMKTWESKPARPDVLEQWEAHQLTSAGVIKPTDLPNYEAEGEFEVDVNPAEPLFLQGQTKASMLEPAKFVKNPEGSMARSASTQSGLAKERRELRDQILADEQEMLEEARSRLANTKSKKAKRKSREIQLEGERRLESVVKKRGRAPVQITAESIIREAQSRPADDMEILEDHRELQTNRFKSKLAVDDQRRKREEAVVSLRKQARDQNVSKERQREERSYSAANISADIQQALLDRLSNSLYSEVIDAPDFGVMLSDENFDKSLKKPILDELADYEEDEQPIARSLKKPSVDMFADMEAELAEYEEDEQVDDDEEDVPLEGAEVLDELEIDQPYTASPYLGGSESTLTGKTYGQFDYRANSNIVFDPQNAIFDPRSRSMHDNFDEQKKKELLQKLRQTSRETYTKDRVVRQIEMYKQNLEDAEHLFGDVNLTETEQREIELMRKKLKIATEAIEAMSGDAYEYDSYTIPESGSVRDKYVPPEGYLAGLGRGAIGFSTRSDIGPERRPVSWTSTEAVTRRPEPIDLLVTDSTYHARVTTSTRRAYTLLKGNLHFTKILVQLLKDHDSSSRHAAYLNQLREQTDHVTFCFVVGTLFITQGQYKEALRTLTSAVASVTDDPKLWRALAFRLEEFAHFRPHRSLAASRALKTYQQIAARLSRGLWRRLVEARANEPHGYRNLALALIDQFNNDPEGNEHVVDEAAKYLTKITAHEWSDRFAAMQIEVNALEELNALVNATHFTQKGLVNAQQWRLKALELNPRLAPLLAQALPCDLRVTIEWDREEANVELHVTEPSNEVCCPMNNSTSSGAMLSVDCAGLGPVTYMLRQAVSGEYTVAVKLFHAMDLSRPVHVRVKIQCFFGTPHLEVTEVHTVALFQNKQQAVVSCIKFH